MLMAWGPFRFTVPTYSVESIQRAHHARAEPQPVIGRAPSIHRLGQNNPTITLSSTFHPRHFNGNGLAQLAGIRQAVDSLMPLQLTHINGGQMNIFGTWVATSVESEETVLDHRGISQVVTVALSMMQYAASPGRAIAQVAALAGGLGLNGSFNAGGMNISAGLGAGGLSVGASVGGFSLNGSIGF